MAPDVEIGLPADQGQAGGDGFELAPRFDAIRSEPGLKDPPCGGDEGGAAGEEDPVDLVRAEPELEEGGVDGGFDRLEVGRDPRLELFARDGPIDANGTGREGEGGAIGLRQRDLERGDGLVEGIAVIVVEDLDQPVQLSGSVAVRARARISRMSLEAPSRAS